MKYGNTEFITKRDSTSETKTRIKKTIHIPYTDKSITIEKGRKATVITTTILVFTEEEKITIETLLHSPGNKRLYIGSHYYENVEGGETFTSKPRTADKKEKWAIDAEFIALDPIPYDVETGEPIYD